MCGICGYINFQGQQTDREALISMRDSLHHRGPDDEGIYRQGPVGLGHRRLSIIDLQSGHQPMSNEDGTVVIVYNGEIYNFQDLKKELTQKGHRFRSRSDTEVILHLYEEKGEQCVDYLRGMFAFALWDRKRNTLFLARDRLGIKPLYYYCDNKTFLFASEIKALLSSGLLQPQVNETGLMRYLKYRYVYGDQTMFKDVHTLMPGHFMQVKNGNVTVKQYWNLQTGHRSGKGFDSSKSDLMESLEESVRMRMISDVPLGVFLSGGIDSSAIAALMSRAADRIKTFSIGFIPEEVNELKHAKVVAEHLASDHYEYIIGPEDFHGLLKKLVYHNDAPLMFPASIPLYILSKHSKNNATVMLSGEGSDELLAGYTSNLKAYWLRRFSSLLPVFMKNSVTRLPVTGKISSALRKTSLNDNELITSFFRLYSDDQVSDMCREKYDGIDSDRYLWEEIGFHDVHGSFLDKLIYFQTKTYLEALLMKQDRMSMAASIESRVPFLDHHFVEQAMRLPDGHKIRWNRGKYILKQACHDLLPESIINRKKMGFPVPLERWFREKDNPFIEILLDNDTRKNSFLNYTFIRKTVDDFTRGNNHVIHHLWTILNIELWRREFFSS